MVSVSPLFTAVDTLTQDERLRSIFDAPEKMEQVISFQFSIRFQ